MEISERLQCLFSGRVTKRADSYTIEIPKREPELGTVQTGESYRVALLGAEPTETAEPTKSNGRAQQPPVEEGELRQVEIEDIGDQGDGIARVERGYVIIVADTEVGDRATVRMAEVRPNVAFADIVERLD